MPGGDRGEDAVGRRRRPIALAGALTHTDKRPLSFATLTALVRGFMLARVGRVCL
jgi:hypothetical protein